MIVRVRPPDLNGDPGGRVVVYSVTDQVPFLVEVLVSVQVLPGPPLLVQENIREVVFSARTGV